MDFKKKFFYQKQKIRLQKRLVRVKYKDTCFCPQKRTKLVSNVRFMSPRKPNSADRKVFWSAFGNPFHSRDFVYLPGEGMRTIHRHKNQGLVMHNWVLARNGLTKDLRGLKYKIMHGAQVRKFKFWGLTYRKHARSKYGCGLTKEEKEKKLKLKKIIKRRSPEFYKLERLSTNKLYQ